MGTRAQFFIGNPSDVSTRQWLGCVAWDGYPDGDCGEALLGASTLNDFVAGVEKIAAKRDDFTNPTERSFPFPWKDDLYLTDVTYAFFDGRVQVTCFHAGWRDLTDNMDDAWNTDAADELPRDVPAPEAGDKSAGPDSIIILTVPDIVW